MIFSKLTFAFIASALLMATASSSDRYDSPGAIAMEARLRAIYQSTDWKADPNKPAERAAYLSAVLRSGKLTQEQQTMVESELATEQLRAGDPRAALETLSQLETLTHSSSHPSSEEEKAFHELRAITYMRLGEQENCVAMHGQHSCVFPLQGNGIHKLPTGAEGAVRDLTWLLEHRPGDALSQWLLNVAYMQLGRYPRGVPAQWLLPESLFASEAKVGEFLDYSSLAGVDVTGHAGGVAVEDFDGDSFLDIITSSSGPLDPLHLFHNNGNGTFSDWTAKAGVSRELGGLNLVLTDFDNDGHPDFLVLRGGWWGTYGNYPLSLLHNRGDGTFEDVTEQSGLLHNGPTQTAAWADYDNDGWLDLFVGYESTPGNHQLSRLYRNNHNGTFTEVGQANALGEQGFVKGVAWGDFNNDGRPDLYLSVREGKNRLLRNDGPADPAHPDPAHWRFTDVSSSAMVVPRGNTFASWFFDFNNDGLPDIFTAGYFVDSMQDVGRFEAGLPAQVGLPHLYRNNGDGTFSDVSHATHIDRAALTMGANFGDLDNDGWLDVYLGTGEPSYQSLLPNRMFRNDSGVRFQDVTTDGGFGHLQKGHAIAFADIENRGHEDIFEEMGGAFVGDTYQSALYRNPGHPGHWITLKLEGTRSNRAAFGARIEIVFRDGTAMRHVFRTVGSVSSFGASPMEQHIGLAKADKVEELRIRWPAEYGKEQVFRNLAVDKPYRVREGDSSPLPVQRGTFTLGQTALRPVHEGSQLHEGSQHMH